MISYIVHLARFFQFQVFLLLFLHFGLVLYVVDIFLGLDLSFSLQCECIARNLDFSCFFFRIPLLLFCSLMCFVAEEKPLLGSEFCLAKTLFLLHYVMLAHLHPIVGTYITDAKIYFGISDSDAFTPPLLVATVAVIRSHIHLVV